MSLMLEIWEMILGHLVEDAHAVVRLMEAVPDLQRNKCREFWAYLEQSLLYPYQYYLFCRVFQFMGARRRVMSWARFLDAPCDSCRTSMQQVFVPTFPLRMKLCSHCRDTHLISETQLARSLPYLLLFYLKCELRYCWQRGSHGSWIKYFLRRDVESFVDDHAFMLNNFIANRLLTEF
jgi:hypothetical protein